MMPSVGFGSRSPKHRDVGAIGSRALWDVVKSCCRGCCRVPAVGAAGLQEEVRSLQAGSLSQPCF